MGDWENNGRLISELWPKYEPTQAELETIARRLSVLRQDDLEKAISDHRTDDEEARFKPDIACILRRYRALRESGAVPSQRMEPLDPEILESDDEEACRWVLAQTEERIAAAVRWCNSVGLLSGVPIDADPRKWSRFTRGVLYATMIAGKEIKCETTTK